MLDKTQFLETYNISDDTFSKANITYDQLTEIQKDYESKFQAYDDAGANLVRILLRYGSVHSVKYRIKNSEHLIEKIIRKRAANTKLDINIANYEEKIQDLIGIRILHLFKSDWSAIHVALKNNFKLPFKPEANIRKGDSETDFKTHGCKIKINKAGYRSVHYIIRTEPTMKSLTAEIQVRTIFEEAWSEVDHKIRYPYYLDNNLINQYLQIFNRLSGGADEMADYVNMLKTETLLKEKIIEIKNNEIESLKLKIKDSSLEESVKKDVDEELDSIKNLGSKSLLDIMRDDVVRYNKYQASTSEIAKRLEEINRMTKPLESSMKIVDNFLKVYKTK